MKKRQRRGGDAEQNRSNWDSLLQSARTLLSDSKELKRDIEGTTTQIKQAWDETASDVERTRKDVSHRVDMQASERRSEADIDESEASGPPSAVSPGKTVHGDPEFPGENEYELSDPITTGEVKSTIEETKQQSPKEIETPIPYTEKEWFSLHAENFPISEESFSIDITESPEAEVDNETRRSERELATGREQDEEETERDS